jgi:hypothetical protein
MAPWPDGSLQAAGLLEVVHLVEGVVDGASCGQQAVMAQDHGVVVAEIAHQSLALVGIEAMVKQIAAAGEHFSIAGWRDDAGFPTWAKARAMPHWIDHSSIAHRPMPTPFNGPQLGVGGVTLARRVPRSLHRACFAKGAVVSIVSVQIISPCDLWLLQTMLPARRAITSPSIV